MIAHADAGPMIVPGRLSTIVEQPVDPSVRTPEDALLAAAGNSAAPLLGRPDSKLTVGASRRAFGPTRKTDIRHVATRTIARTRLMARTATHRAPPRFTAFLFAVATRLHLCGGARGAYEPTRRATAQIQIPAAAASMARCHLPAFRFERRCLIKAPPLPCCFSLDGDAQ